ncbi:MAG: hypothetical protein JW904_08785 [Spirochaetales bacterium]|nr:hypothetical protein [Spirochaetales bacterium]
MRNNHQQSIKNRCSYTDADKLLKKAVTIPFSELLLAELGLDIRSFPFHSSFRSMLPEGNEYLNLHGKQRAVLWQYLQQNTHSNKHVFGWLEIPDEEIAENNDFRYLVFLPHGMKKAEKAVFLFHGLNERRWDKYFAWAYTLACSLGCAVILFPIAFHMNRAPEAWANPRLMQAVVRERKAMFPDNSFASFANAAISMRLQTVPARFIYSGLQTMDDIVTLIAMIRAGLHQHISPSAQFDMFGYSIGAFLGEMLLLSHSGGLFDTSKLVLFCGGAAMDLSYPVSKIILDSEAAQAVGAFAGPDIRNKIAADQRLFQTLALYENETDTFGFLVNSHLNPMMRRYAFQSVRNRILSISMSKDRVIPPASVRQTLNGDADKTSPFDHELDFPYAYTHENPFPFNGENTMEVENGFDTVFQLAADFLG